LAEQQTLNLRVLGSIPRRLTTLSSALSGDAKCLKSGAVTAVRLNRFSVKRQAFRKEQLLKPLLVVESLAG
jgi:hypothetical protein